MLVESLLKFGAEVNASSPGGTALHYAVHLGRTDLVSILIQGGADLNAKVALTLWKNNDLGQ